MGWPWTKGTRVTVAREQNKITAQNDAIPPGVYLHYWLTGNENGSAHAVTKMLLSKKDREALAGVDHESVTVEQHAQVMAKISNSFHKVIFQKLCQDNSKLRTASKKCAICGKGGPLSAIFGRSPFGSTSIICFFGWTCTQPGGKCHMKLETLAQEVSNGFFNEGTLRPNESRLLPAGATTHDVLQNCKSCHKISSDAKSSFKRCSICKKAYYCSETCQKKDWARHKRECTKAKSLKADGKEMKGKVDMELVKLAIRKGLGLE